MKRRGPGRPALPKADRKAAIFSVRLSPEERGQVEDAAQATGELSDRNGGKKKILTGTLKRSIAPRTLLECEPRVRERSI